jgi:arabinan endo-1,5-alpha-L-arabinosidase
MVVAGGKRAVGAGHFGRTVIDEGVEIASFRWEADLDRSGRNVLAIRPLLWKNGWPYAGEKLEDGNYSIISERRGYSLEISVDFVRMEQERAMWHRVDPNQPTKSIPNQTLDQVKEGWNAIADAWKKNGNIGVRIGDYMGRPHQNWTITAVPEAGGYLSNPYFKITIEGTERALCATADMEVETVPQFTGDESQLWRIEQLTDGTYRIMPKKIPGKEGVNKEYVLYSIGDSTPILEKYDFNSDNSKWNLKK